VRTFVLAYRIHGRKRFLKLGRVGGEVGSGLADARLRAREELRRVNAGTDPQARREELGRASNVAELVEQFIDAGAPDKATKTTREYRVLLRAEVEGSDFGRLPIQQAKRPEARRFFEAIARRAPVQANRVYQLVRAAFAWAVRHELGLEANPCEGLSRPRKERPRDRVLSDTELRVAWAALDAEEGPGRSASEKPRRLVPEVVAAAVRLLALLGTRRGETLRMRWQDLDLNVAEWRIPGEFRKGGVSLTVPLSVQAKAILTDVKATANGRLWVFAGERGASIMANPGRIGAMIRAAIKATARRCGVRIEPFTLHDLRRTCATGCGELGAPPHVVALILGHQTMPGTGRVTGIYDRAKRVREVAPWLTKWGEHVERLVSGEHPRADVVPIRPA